MSIVTITFYDQSFSVLLQWLKHYEIMFYTNRAIKRHVSVLQLLRGPLNAFNWKRTMELFMQLGFGHNTDLLFVAPHILLLFYTFIALYWYWSTRLYTEFNEQTNVWTWINNCIKKTVPMNVIIYNDITMISFFMLLFHHIQQSIWSRHNTIHILHTDLVIAVDNVILIAPYTFYCFIHSLLNAFIAS